VLVHAGKNNYFTESYTREDFSSCADAGYTQNEKPEFRIWHACHISGCIFAAKTPILNSGIEFKAA